METSIEKRLYNVSFAKEPILEIKNLTISTRAAKKALVKNLNLVVNTGGTFGLIGESGSGKSLTATAVLGLLPQSLQITSGMIKLEDHTITSLSEKELRCLRGKEIAYLSQNYQSYFTPFIKIGKQFIEIIRSHSSIKKSDAKQMALHWLKQVNLPAERVFNSYPYQLSGGQLQRTSIASAIMFKPKLIIADEPTTALDVITGEKILDLLTELQQQLNCAILLISHNLKHITSRTEEVALMYGGQIVEKGKTNKVFENPVHPYTRLLFQSRLKLSKFVPNTLPTIYGEPGLIAEQGCPFAFRCPYVINACTENPSLKMVHNSHWTACHTADLERKDRLVGN